METTNKQLQTKNENLINFVAAITGKINGNVTIVKGDDQEFDNFPTQTIKMCFNEYRPLFNLIRSISDVFCLDVRDIIEAITTGNTLSYNGDRFILTIAYNAK